jgi:DnaJ-class molecular chaperone
VSALAPTEIEALARIIDDLDYYQLLHLKPSASPRDVKNAYFASSRAFHPDLYRGLGPSLRAAIAIIAKRISEAYSVLRDPRRRPAYDKQLDAGGDVRIQLASSEKQPAGRPDEITARSPQGRQYLGLANADLQREDYVAALRNLQTAVTFEPANEGLKALLADTREKSR